jgi:hypothetical protein
MLLIIQYYNVEIGTTLTSLFVNEFVQRLFEEIKERPVNDVLDYTKSKVQEVIEKIKEQSVQG